MLAVPFDSLTKLLPSSVDSQELREKIAHFENAPITGVHFWFDRQISDLPHAVLLDRTIQWMFHKSELLGKDTQSSYIELVISASKTLLNMPRQEIIDLALKEVREFCRNRRKLTLETVSQLDERPG